MKIFTNRPYYSDTLGIDDPDGVIRGVYVGGCVDERNAWSIWEGLHSHAHSYTADPWYGWACVLSPKHLFSSSGKMTPIFLHEIAHLLCPNQGHTAKWKRTITRLGAGSEIERCGLKKL